MPWSLSRRAGALTLSGLLVTGAGAVAAAPVANAEDATCALLTAPVYKTTNPTLNTNLLTRWEGEYEKSQVKFGFTEDNGVIGDAAPRASAGLAPVVRMYNATTADFLWAVGDADVARNEQRGFGVSNVGFYAPTTAASCTVGVHRVTNGTNFRMVTDTAELAALTSAGWRDEGVVFHVREEDSAAPPAPPAPGGGGTFSIAVIPDTQTEVVARNDTRFVNRAQWLADNKDNLGLAYAIHTGDVTNWGWLDQYQFDVAKRGMSILGNAGVPYAVASGNHDTAVVGHNDVPGSRGYGGGAYVNNPECLETLKDACRSWKLIRDTDEFNQNFPLSSFQGVGGAFEAGKSDNFWTTFEAGGASWLVLTLELYPRPEAVAWGAKVVRDHPTHNVILNTHGFMDSGNGIEWSNGGYGNSSGRYLWDNLVKLYPNVKMTFSGHTGSAGSRVDTGVNGNTIVSYLTTYHSTWGNPVRIVTINTETGSVDTVVQSPNVNQTWLDASTSDTISVIR